MKYVIKTLFYIVSSFILLLSLAMSIIELRLVLSLDWMLYDNLFNGFIRYFLRLLISLIYLFVILIEFIRPLRRINFIKKYHFIFNIMMFIISIVLLIFTTNYIGLVSFVLMLLFIILKFCLIYKPSK